MYIIYMFCIDGKIYRGRFFRSSVLTDFYVFLGNM